MAPSDHSPRLVCDAGPLIHLDELGSLDLLSDFSSVLVPDPVWLEVEKHRPEALAQAAFPLIRSTVERPETPEFQALVRAFSLGAGEQAALALMEGVAEAIFLSDDAAARLAAKALRFQSQGTLGILLRSLRRGQRSRQQVLELLQEIPSRSTLHLRPSLLLSIVEQVRADG